MCFLRWEKVTKKEKITYTGWENKKRKNEGWKWELLLALVIGQEAGAKKQQYSLTVGFLHYFFIMPVGFNLKLTYGLKPQVNSIKIVTVYRRSIFQFKSHYTTRTTPRFGCSTKLSHVQWSSYLDGDQIRISHVFRRRYLRLQNFQPCVMLVLLFLNYLFVISPCPHSCVFIYNIVKINSRMRQSNSSQFSWLFFV